ncbi:hypothetical protein B0H13DRAFT_2232698 [Mycena leptocephala]|nr:hypothetical protein B0H13DRAFT_2232698 [Mycena leptocephala]
MDNPQHYQPLSYALHPPNTSTTPKPGDPQLEEDEEENLVADHLNPNDHASASPTSKPVGTGNTPVQEHQFLQEPDPGGKRRPGRPRGSKNRKVQSPSGLAIVKLDTPHPTGTGTAPPQLPNVTSQNQQYYEFQWRMLNLCAEFYGAAEELVKGTPPLVVAQCYQMGPGSKVDPLIMLNDAKRICDTLSFVVSLGTQPTYSYTRQYPSPYYAPYGYTGYYATPQQQPPPPPQPQPAAKPQPPPPQASTSTLKPPPHAAPSASSNGGTQGPWSDEEVERLKKLAEDSKTASGSKEIEWDWVAPNTAQSHGTRSEGKFRAKRLWRANEPAPPNPATVNSKMTGSTSTPSNATGSPAMSHTTSTPIAGLPWPMPTVAAANVSPVLSPSVQGEQRPSYYRPRPAPTDASTTTRPNSHQFMYQNGPVQNNAS